MHWTIFLLLAPLVMMGAPRSRLERALDAQDRAALEQIAGELGSAAAKSPQDDKVQYRLAKANSLLAQLAIELGDKVMGKNAAEAGIQAARAAVSLKPDEAEYHRVLGMLCGQVIPANVLAGLKYGKCALEEVNKAIEMNPRSAEIWLSRGVGNYYLPAMFGGGVDKAVEDMRKSVELDANSPEAHLWLGIALRKAGRNAEARKALARSLELNPLRKWAKQQLDKTPAQ